ncbi:MAG: putative Ig domain-containing protein [Acidimicrobiales bacterium]
MNISKSPRPHRRRSDAGFTLIEVIIAVVILAGITGATVTALLVSLKAQSSTHQRVAESNDAQFISGYLVRDGQAAGGSRPEFGTLDSTLGVSLTDPAECAVSSADLLVRFKWKDRSVAPGTPPTSVVATHVANYFYVPATNELVRRTCVDGIVQGTFVLGRNIASDPAPSASCFPAGGCPGMPDTVSISVTETNNPVNAPAPYQFSLTASIRPEAQIRPTGGTAQTVPLLALGSGTCAPGGSSGISLTGTTDLHITVGGAIVNGDDASSSCPSMYINGNANYTADTTAILAGGTCDVSGSGSCPPYTTMANPLSDPLAWLSPPPGAGACVAGGSNPSGGPAYVAGVYNQPVSVNGSATFAPGIYIFCRGLSIGGSGTIVGTGVHFYFAGGTLSMTGTPEIQLAAPTSGDYQGILMWLPRTNPEQQLTMLGGAGLNSYQGIVYAPVAQVHVVGNAATSIGSIVAQTVWFSGTSDIELGPEPPLAVSTATLPNAAVGVPYSVNLVAANGTTPRSWTAPAGLPAWLSLNTTGTLSGTPTAVGTTAPFTVTVTDSAAPAATASRSFTITVNAPPLSLTPPAGLPTSRPRNTAYTSGAFTIANGTAPYTCSVAIVRTAGGGPANPTFLSCTPSPTSGTTVTLTGTLPNAARTYQVTVTVVDNLGASVSYQYTLTTT